MLSGSGGAVSILPELTDALSQKTGYNVILDPNPNLLVAPLLSRFREESCQCDSKANRD